MKKTLILLLVVLCFGNVSDIIIKINEIENMKKNFLNINYNIFSISKITPSTFFGNKKNISLKIYAIFNHKVNINGEWLNAGDEINGYKIVKVLDNGIILKKENKIVFLKMKNNILKVTK